MNRTVLSTHIAGTTDPVATPWLNLDRSTAQQVGLHLVTTGNLAGSFAIKVSCSPTTGQEDAADITDGWETPGGTPVAAPAGAPTSQFVQTTALNAGKYQVVFVPVSGTGDVRVHRWSGE
jgi:hypothetical protein